MEDPRVVEGVAKWFLALSAGVAIGLSILLGSLVPVGVWLYLVIGLAIGFLLVAALYAVTVWPLVLLIAKLFGKDRRRAAT